MKKLNKLLVLNLHLTGILALCALSVIGFSLLALVKFIELIL